MVLEYLLWCTKGRSGDGSDASGGAFHQRYAARKRYNRDENIADTIY